MLLQEYFPRDVRVWKEAKALTSAGHHVTVICLRDVGEPSREICDGVNVVRVNLTKKRGSKLRYIYEYGWFFLLARKQLKRITATKVPDIVHVHNLPDFLVFAAAPAKSKGAKVILDMHEIMPEFYISKFRLQEGSVVIKVLKYLERKSLEYADKVITINESVKKLFMSRASIAKEIAIVMNTVDEDILPIADTNRGATFIAMYHGTITKTYNLAFVIKALSGIKEHLADFEFHIYGDGQEVETLITLVDDLQLGNIVKLKGRIAYKDIPQAISVAKLGIIAMQRDVMLDLSFSNKLAEYVHSNLPVLHTELPSVLEYFPSEVISYFHSNDEADFQEKLKGVIQNYDQANRQALEASELYKDISWNVMELRLKDVVRELMDS